MVAVLALAVASTAVLVLTDSAGWLRFGVLAALWAALLGVFLASRFRKTVAEREAQVADLQSVYELELEREVAARREYELEVEAEARKRVEESNREDLAELRNELRSLRESLERLTGGEVLVERFALRAQSTRMRSLSDGQPRVVASGEDSTRMRRSIVAGPGVAQPSNVVDAASTELIPRADAPAQPAPVTPVRREPQRRETQRPPGYRPEPSRPQTPRDGERQDERRETPATAAQSVASQPTKVSRPVARPEQRQLPAQPQRSGQAAPPQQAWPGQGQVQRPTQVRRPQQVEPAARQGVRRDSAPTIQHSREDLRPVPEPTRQQPQRPEPSRSEHQRPEPQRPEAMRPEPPRAEPPRAEPPRAEPIRAEPVRREEVRPEPIKPAPQRIQPRVDQPQRVEPPRVESTGGHRRVAEPAPVERSRHRVDDQPPPAAPPVPEETGGRRRAEEAPRDWQSYREWRQESTPEPPAAEPEPTHTVWESDDPEITGAHAAGKSVTELLAAHGNQDDAPRRHRRRAD